MSLLAFCQWLEQQPFSIALRESETLFPWIESVHVLAITLVVGTIAVVDLRLLGIGSLQQPVSKVMAEVLPFTRAAFILALLTGGLLFSSHAVQYLDNLPFQVKMVLLLVALINIVVFHFITARNIAQWDSRPRTPFAVKLAGGASLLLWAIVVGFGRWIGFV